MKNVILTHDELQKFIFLSFAHGITQHYPVRKGYFLTSNAEKGRDSFTLELWRSASFSEKGDAMRILTYEINKGAYEMNDHRLGVMIRYMGEHGEKFIEQVNERLNQIPE